MWIFFSHSTESRMTDLSKQPITTTKSATASLVQTSKKVIESGTYTNLNPYCKIQFSYPSNFTITEDMVSIWSGDLYLLDIHKPNIPLCYTRLVSPYTSIRGEDTPIAISIAVFNEYIPSPPLKQAMCGKAEKTTIGKEQMPTYHMTCGDAGIYQDFYYSYIKEGKWLLRIVLDRSATMKISPAPEDYLLGHDFVKEFLDSFVIN